MLTRIGKDGREEGSAKGYGGVDVPGGDVVSTLTQSDLAELITVVAKSLVVYGDISRQGDGADLDGAGANGVV